MSIQQSALNTQHSAILNFGGVLIRGLLAGTEC